jgi:hypothetical protein
LQIKIKRVKKKMKHQQISLDVKYQNGKKLRCLAMPSVGDYGTTGTYSSSGV